MEEDFSDGESFLEGFEAGETSNKIKFERKARDTNQGDYATKPDPNAKQILHFNAKRTGYILLIFLVVLFYNYICISVEVYKLFYPVVLVGI